MKSSSCPARFAGTGKSEPLKVVYRRIDELKPDAANPRRHSKRQIRQISASIEAFGFNVPILIDAKGNSLPVMVGCLRLASSAGARFRRYVWTI